MRTQESSLEVHDLSAMKRRLMARRLNGEVFVEANGVQARPANARVPVSADQYPIWLHASMYPDLPTYNEPISLRYRGALRVETLEASFNEFLRRHEAWRTSFVLDQGKPLQVVAAALEVSLRVCDLRRLSLSEQEREREAERLALEQAILPFQLDKPPLLRVLVLQMDDEDYRIELVLHHIIFDGVSLRRTFLPELAAIYSAFSEGRDHHLPEPSLQYGDYALWRDDQISDPSMTEHLQYWREALAGELPVLRLPFARPRPAPSGQAGSVERLVIPPQLTAALREIAGAHAATLYMTLLAAFKALLFRYSGQGDLIVGSAVDGRRGPEVQGTMGYILDTFAIRTRPSPELSFSEYLFQVKGAVLDALSAAEVPFDRVLDVLPGRSDRSRHPLLQAFFSFQPITGETPPGWEMKTAALDVGAAKFELYLEVEEQPLQILARLVYNSGLFDSQTIRRLRGHWLTLLQAVADDPSCKLQDLPLLTPDERDLMLGQWNTNLVPVLPETIHGLVDAQVRRAPGKVAIHFEDRAFTYAQLNERAEQFALHLGRAGAGPGILAAVFLERSENLVAGLLGVLKTGAAYLPLDPRTPPARILLCLEDAAPGLILTQRSLAAEIPSNSATVIFVEDVLEAVREVANPIPQLARHAESADPDNTAYIIHTSGTTGRPKGVEITHRSAVNFLLSMQREPGFMASDSILALATVSFDIAVLELFLPLISGGRIVLASRDVALDPHRLQSMIESSGCTMMQATPATWRNLLAIGWKGKAGLRALCGGEALTGDLAEALLARCHELWNMYGPTETTVWSIIKRIDGIENVIPVGRPIANITAYILDANLQPSPIGVPGELYLGGAGVAKGYRGHPELTAQKFVHVAIAGGERLYRTGDVALFRSDGTIECHGRTDNQVKVRGYRIELEDVEASLNAHPRVGVAAARVWPDATGGNRLSAYLVGKNGPPPDAQELRAFLQARLPEYMIPSDVVALEKIPVTANGKLDRKALAPPPAKLSRPAAEQPLTEIERTLAGIWAEVLGVSQINRSDNFFDLGGHSLTLIHLFARINKQFSSSLPITAIFNAQTLSALAAVLVEKTRLSSLVPVRTTGNNPPLFMVHSYLLYRGLSQALGEDQPFYGLRELEEDGDPSLEQRALRYAKDIRESQRRGPYRIAGWCAAGPLAAEVARKLLEQGEEVASLILFDPTPLDEEPSHRRRSFSDRLASLKRTMSYHRDKTRGASIKELWKYGMKTAARWARDARDRFFLDNWILMVGLSNRLGFTLPQFMHNTSRKTFASLREFREESMPVHITIIRSEESRHLDYKTAACGWERVAGAGIDIHWAPGDHESMFGGENLDTTARLVRECLSLPASSARPYIREEAAAG